MPLATVDTSLLRRLARSAATAEDRDAIARAILRAEARMAERHSLTRARWFTIACELAAENPLSAELLEVLECFPVLDLLALRQVIHNTIIASTVAHIAPAWMATKMEKNAPTQSQERALRSVAKAIDRCLARLVGEATAGAGSLDAYATMVAEASSAALAGEFKWGPCPIGQWGGWEFPIPFRPIDPAAAEPGVPATK